MTLINNDESIRLTISFIRAPLESLESADVNWRVTSDLDIGFFVTEVPFDFDFKLGFDVRARDDNESFLLEEVDDFEREDAFAEACAETDDAFFVLDDFFGNADLIRAEFDAVGFEVFGDVTGVVLNPVTGLNST